MFRRLPESLPKNPEFPADLKKLGYRITDDDKIKSIQHPDDDFRFFITNNQRYNDVQREAMHTIIRDEIVKRMTTLGVPTLHVPTLSPLRPSAQIPTLQILATPPELLPAKKRVIVVVNRSFEDLALWSYRVVNRAGGINAGSAVSFVKDIQARFVKQKEHNEKMEEPGLIILNPGQLLYSYKHARAMTPISWDALPRKSAVHPAPIVHPQYNHIESNATASEHVRFIFEKLLDNPALVAPDAELYLIGLCDGGDLLLKYLSTDNNWSIYRDRIAALALTCPTPIMSSTAPFPITRDSDFVQFLRSRARAWTMSSHALNTPLENTTPLQSFSVTGIDGQEGKDTMHEQELMLFPLLAGGSENFDEAVMSTAQGAMLDWFEEVARAGKGYENEKMTVAEEVRKEREVFETHDVWG